MDDGGATFTDLTAGTPNYMGGQGWYDTAVIVDPTNPAIVYVGGSPDYPDNHNLLRSSDSGVTWTNISGGVVSPQVEQNAMTVDCNRKLLDGSDACNSIIDVQTGGSH